MGRLQQTRHVTNTPFADIECKTGRALERLIMSALHVSSSLYPYKELLRSFYGVKLKTQNSMEGTLWVMDAKDRMKQQVCQGQCVL